MSKSVILSESGQHVFMYIIANRQKEKTDKN